MLTRRFLVICTAVFAIVFSINAQSNWWKFSSGDDNVSMEGVTEIVWEDLIPDDFVPPENPMTTMTQEEIDKLMDGSEESNVELAKLREIFNYAPVVSELDGQRIKIPAYITPLEFNDQSLIKEFLLVPYIGACIHVPPPPANQILHAQSDEAVQYEGMYAPVWAIGTIRAETVKSDLAESGYRLEVERVLPYEEE